MFFAVIKRRTGQHFALCLCLTAVPTDSAAVQCPACASVGASWWAEATDGEYFTTTETFRYLRCKTCGVLFIDPVPYDRLAEIYPPNYYSFVSPENSLVQRLKRKLDERMFRGLLRDLPGTSLNLLDVGGGAGWELTWIRELEPRIHFTQVVDLDAAAEATARANGHEYFRGRAEEFVTERRFDLILMLNLIEHVQDPRALLAKMRGVLSPGGLIFLKTPNTDSLDARIFRHANWAGYHCPRHWVLFTRESFSELAAKVGLKVASFRYTQGAPFWAASILYWLHRHGMISLSRNRPAWYHPLFGPISAGCAIFDFLRMPFSKTSQMFVTLKL
jgi:2-polyprenyl-3-methyl-5-hydroxy-6-metoxy-1,4-benzoquinol methylase